MHTTAAAPYVHTNPLPNGHVLDTEVQSVQKVYFLHSHKTEPKSI